MVNRQDIGRYMLTFLTLGMYTQKAFKPKKEHDSGGTSGSGSSKHQTSNKKKIKDKIKRKMQTASRRVNRGKKSKT